jgi:hypothetical protein
MLAETRQIDLITAGRGNIHRLLLVVETGEWQMPGAKWMLLEKIATYARYAMGGQMVREDPGAAGAPVQLVIVSDDPLPPEIRALIGRAGAMLTAEGVGLDVETPEDGGLDGPIQEPASGPAAGHTIIRPRPEYPHAEAFVPGQRFHRWRSRIARPVRRIVLHISDGQHDYQRMVRALQSPVRGGQGVLCSAHYVVGRGGEVVQMVRHDDVAWHARGANADSIGVVHIARAPQVLGPADRGLPPDPEQLRASARLVRWLCEQYRLAPVPGTVVGHDEVEPGTSHRGCPRGAWDWDRYLTLLRDLE